MLWICNFIKNETLAQVFPCEFCKYFKNIFLADYHRTTLSDYSSIIVVKGELANESVNYDKEIKAHLFQLEILVIKNDNPNERIGLTIFEDGVQNKNWWDCQQ